MFIEKIPIYSKVEFSAGYMNLSFKDDMGTFIKQKVKTDILGP